MAIELVSCPVCGVKNSSTRAACLSCGANLSTSFLTGPETERARKSFAGSLAQWIKRYTKNWNTIRAMQLGFISAILLVALSLFYYLVIFSPRREEARSKEEEQRLALQKKQTEISQKLEVARLALEVMKEQQRQQEKAEEEFKESANTVLLDACLSDAYKDYLVNWVNANRIEAQRKAAEIRGRGVTAVVSCTTLGLNPSLCRSVAEYAARESQAAASNSDLLSPLPISVANSLRVPLKTQ